MANQMWMGIPYGHAQWVPCPLIDSTVTRNRYVERIQFQNGGGDLARSNQYQMEYNINVNGLAHEVEGVDAYNRFASGLHGDGYIYVAYPPHFDTNIFSAQWSTPALSGWTNSIYMNGTVIDNVGDILVKNYVTKPNFENGIPSGQWISSGGTGMTATISTSNPAPGNTKSLHVSYTTTSTDGLKYTFNISDAPVSGNYYAVIKGYFPLIDFPTVNTKTTFLDASNTVLYTHWDMLTGTADFGDQLFASASLDMATYPTATKIVFEIHRDEYNSNPLDFYVWGAALMGNNEYFIGHYFDGNSPSTTEYGGVATPSWTGTANNSISQITILNIPANANLPNKSMRFDIANVVDYVPDQKFTIAVPPNHTLLAGVTGNATGSGRVVLRRLELDGTYTDETVPFTPYNTYNGRISLNIPGGANGCFIQFFLSKTTSAVSTVTINSMIARIVPEASVGSSHPYLSDNAHVMGEGSTGLMFADDAIVETYSYLYPPRKAISTKLVEVEKWR